MSPRVHEHFNLLTYHIYLSSLGVLSAILINLRSHGADFGEVQGSHEWISNVSSSSVLLDGEATPLAIVSGRIACISFQARNEGTPIHGAIIAANRIAIGRMNHTRRSIWAFVSIRSSPTEEFLARNGFLDRKPDFASVITFVHTLIVSHVVCFPTTNGITRFCFAHNFFSFTCSKLSKASLLAGRRLTDGTNGKYGLGGTHLGVATAHLTFGFIRLALIHTILVSPIVCVPIAKRKTGGSHALNLFSLAFSKLLQAALFTCRGQCYTSCKLWLEGTFLGVATSCSTFAFLRRNTFSVFGVWVPPQDHSLGTTTSTTRRTIAKRFGILT